MAIDVTHLYKKTVDWKAKSVGDISVFAGVGGGIKHLAIWSQSLNIGTHATVVFGGFGVEAKAKVPKIDKMLGESYDFMKAYIENAAKGVEGATKSAGGYEPITVFKAFSLFDFSTGYIAQGEAGAAAVAGAKVDAITVYSGTSPIFSIPPAIGAAWGLGAGAQASGGLILTDVTRQISDAQKWEMEKKRGAQGMFYGNKM